MGLLVKCALGFLSKAAAKVIYHLPLKHIPNADLCVKGGYGFCATIAIFARYSKLSGYLVEISDREDFWAS